MSRKFKLVESLTKVMGTLHEDLCTFMIVSRIVILRIRNISEKIFI